MGFIPIAFGAPLMLAALVALPAIWWLLRFTPPRPQVETFPPLRILARVMRQEEQPQKSPWWLTLLRLLLAACLIVALAEPVINPRPAVFAGTSAVAIVIDNGWASAQGWKARVAAAERLIEDAGRAGAPILLAGTAEKANSEIGPFDARQSLDRMHAMGPRPIPVDRKATFARVSEALKAMPGARVAYLSDGIAMAGDEAAFAMLAADRPSALQWYDPDLGRLAGIASVENSADALNVDLIRPVDQSGSRSVIVGAYDEKGRRIAQAAIAFAPGKATARGSIRVPFELRNDIATLRIDGAEQAAATRLLDDKSRRRRVALVSGEAGSQAQPLLSPLYYISRALQPFADIVRPRSDDLANAIPQLLDEQPSVLVMADIDRKSTRLNSSH